MIDRPICEHLEILRATGRRRVRVRLVERVCHAYAFYRLLPDAVDHDRLGNAGCFKDCWHNVDHVVELSTDAATILDAVRPRDGHALAGAAKMRGHLFGPF